MARSAEEWLINTGAGAIVAHGALVDVFCAFIRKDVLFKANCRKGLVEQARTMLWTKKDPLSQHDKIHSYL